MPSTGPNSPNTAATSGSPGWSLVNNIKTNNDTPASQGMASGATTDKLRATDFSFSFTSGAVITGILIEVREQSTGAFGDVRDFEIYLVKDGSTEVGNNASLGTNIGSSYAYRSYGGDGDLWGTSWTAAEVAASTFGVSLRYKNFGGSNGTAEIDHVRVTVFYSFTGAIGATIGAITASLAASHTPPTYTGSIGATTGKATAALSGAFATVTRTGDIAATIGPAIASLAATFSPGTDTGSIGATTGPPTASLSGTFSAGTKTGNIAATIKAATASLSGEFDAPVYTGSIAATTGPVSASIEAQFYTQIFTGSLAATTGPAAADLAGTFSEISTYSGVISVTIGAVTTYVTVFNDTFATDTSANYTAATGSGTISGGELSTSSSEFLYINNTAGSGGIGEVTASGKVSAVGGAFQVIGSYVDADNYLFAEVTINGSSSTVELWARESGVETQIGDTLTFNGTTDTYYEVAVTWSGVSASVTFEGFATTSGSYFGTGNKAGVGAALASGTAGFDSLGFVLPSLAQTCSGFSFWKCCGGDPCATCSSGTAPNQFQVDISGMADSGCDSCTLLNGSWVLTRLGSTCAFGSPCCTWRYVDSPGGTITCSGCSFLNGTGTLINIQLYLYKSGSNYFARLTAGSSGSSIFRLDFGTSAPDCNDFDELEIPFLDNTTCAFSPFNDLCEGSGATVKLTAL